MDMDFVEKKVNEFNEKVIKTFEFLEKDYGFSRRDIEKYFKYPRDMNVRIVYISKKVAIEVGWYLVNAGLGLGIIELKKGEIPGKYSYYGREGYGKAIGLSTLVEFITNGKVKHPLHVIELKQSARTSNRKHKENAKMINENMEGLLKIFSNWLVEYAEEILKGDLSIFPKVIEYTRKKFEEENYYLKKRK